MNIEKNLFKKSIFNENNLLEYGFNKENDDYIYRKEILDNTFTVIITVDKNKIISGKIIENDFLEEYTNFRIENSPLEFASIIREEYIKILNDIKDKCCEEQYFIYNQTNRITNEIIKRYYDEPVFPWEKYKGYGVFKNPINDKWYALIMDINFSKIDGTKEDKMIEAINIKLEPDIIKELLTQKGFYKAYHMNKQNWITIVLDDTIDDNKIINLIDLSHKYTEISNEWLFPANPKYYDIMNCFNETNEIIWKQTNSIQIEDTVYIYVTVPISSIIYKCIVVEKDIPYDFKSDNLSIKRVMKIKLEKRYEVGKYDMDTLKKYGVKSVRSPRRISAALKKYIEKTDNK